MGITRSFCAVSLLDLPLRAKPLSAVESETSRRLARPEKFEFLGSRVLVALDVPKMVPWGSFGTGSFVDIQLSFSADSSAWLVNDDCGRLSAGFDLALIDRLWFAWAVFGRPMGFRVSGPRLVAKLFVMGWRMVCAP